eukprot:TRINITY_DN67617_c0_g1_i1.p1 TRINITY_DN67617_c0_g1~~TRINITY_DN67617_c0_g1_i1.p1  ORF type:complete len:357 (-),score=85.19 TRINITY_DN67617_c0_g1_i1:105-1175(-)
MFVFKFFFFFSSRRRHTRCREVSWARRCVQETDAEYMGGSIGLSSELGHGTTFWFNLKLQKTELTLSDDALSVSRVEEQQLKLQGKVLLVEDNPVNQQYAVQILKGLGVDVDLSGNGADALRRLQNQHYDLVLMDCQMPEMDGYRATELIRQGELENGAQRLPIIALTANAMQEDRQHCLRAGMDEYLSKPFSKAQIAMLLQRWLADPSAFVGPVGNAEPSAAPAVDPATAGVDAPLLSETIEQLREMDDDGSFLDCIIAAYLQKSPEDIEQLEQGLLHSDAAALRMAAHSFKSSSYNLGAHQLAELCKKLEMMGRENDLDQAASLCAAIDLEYLRVKGALIKIQENNNAENSDEQ